MEAIAAGRRGFAMFANDGTDVPNACFVVPLTLD